MSPSRVCEMQMTVTVYMNLELLERGDLSIVIFVTLPRVYIIKFPYAIKQIETLNTFKSHLKAFLLSHAYDQSGLTVQEDYAL